MILFPSTSLYLCLGTALEALSLMQAFLKSRPSSFRSLEEGIEWRYVVIVAPVHLLIYLVWQLKLITLEKSGLEKIPLIN